MDKMNASELLLYSTIRIECECRDGISTGTGFFFQFLEREESSVPVIVTNKHVIKNAIIGKLRFSLRESNGEIVKGKFCEYRLDRFESRWIHHPDNNVDLCILPIASICEELLSKGYNILCTYCNVDMIPTQH
ncbi:MAG: hypothetical protein K2K91_05690 [Ruminococcus sp.]|nr:hypothetical protein [Ruminococcus sp.]